jgi:hypothetical protein
LSAGEVARFYTKGNISVHAFFTSVSGLNRNFISDKCNVLIRIIPAPEVNPAYIAEIAWAPHEEEFLYGVNTCFTVLSVDEITIDTFEIWLMECVI